MAATQLNVGDMYGPMYIESIEGNVVTVRCMMCLKGIIFTNFSDEAIISAMEHHICEVTAQVYDGKKIGSYVLLNLKRLEDGRYEGIAKCLMCHKKFNFTGTPELFIPTIIGMSCDFFKPDTTPIPLEANFTTISKNQLGLKYKIDIDKKIKELQDEAQLLQIEQIIEDYKNNPPIEEEPEEPVVPTPPTEDDEEIIPTPPVEDDEEEDEEKPSKPSKPKDEDEEEDEDLEDLDTPKPNK